MFNRETFFEIFWGVWAFCFTACLSLSFCMKRILSLSSNIGIKSEHLVNKDTLHNNSHNKKKKYSKVPLLRPVGPQIISFHWVWFSLLRLMRYQVLCFLLVLRVVLLGETSVYEYMWLNIAQVVLLSNTSCS